MHGRRPCYAGRMSDTLEAVLPLHAVPYAEQLAQREERVRAALSRGGIDAPVSPIVPSPLVDGARARIQLHTGPGGILGFHRPQSHDVVEVDLARVARPEVVEAAARLKEGLGGRTLRGGVEIRTDGSRTVLVFEQQPPVPGERLGPHVAVGPRRVCGDPRLFFGRLRVSPGSFYQVNLEVNERIVADVEARLVALAPARLLDLYCGVGNLSARAVGRGVGATLIESEPSAVKDARANLPDAEVKAGDAGKFQAGSAFFDVALLDPPRAGAPGLLPNLVLTRPRAIVYVSCEPTTLARDIAGILPKGYRVVHVQPYDMFPGTLHVETMVVLERA